MNLVTVIENIELERTNNRQLGHAIEARLLTLKQATTALISQLEEHRGAIDKAIEASKNEIVERDAALAALIGGE